MSKIYLWIGIGIILLFIIGSLRSKRETSKLKGMGIYPEMANIEDVKRLIREGYKIEAIKLYRKIYNVDLKEAKEKVEEIKKKYYF